MEEFIFQFFALCLKVGKVRGRKRCDLIVEPLAGVGEHFFPARTQVGCFFGGLCLGGCILFRRHTEGGASGAQVLVVGLELGVREEVLLELGGGAGIGKRNGTVDDTLLKVQRGAYLVESFLGDLAGGDKGFGIGIVHQVRGAAGGYAAHGLEVVLAGKRGSGCVGGLPRYYIIYYFLSFSLCRQNFINFCLAFFYFILLIRNITNNSF